MKKNRMFHHAPEAKTLRLQPTGNLDVARMGLRCLVKGSNKRDPTLAVVSANARRTARTAATSTQGDRDSV
jgi:hypothetical protein